MQTGTQQNDRVVLLDNCDAKYATCMLSIFPGIHVKVSEGVPRHGPIRSSLDSLTDYTPVLEGTKAGHVYPLTIQLVFSG